MVTKTYLRKHSTLESQATGLDTTVLRIRPRGPSPGLL